MGSPCAVDVQAWTLWPSSRGGFSRSDQRGPLPCSFGLRLAYAADSFGAWQTVCGWFRELARRFLFQTIHDIELMLDRERQGREQSPSAAVIDSQSIKAPSAEKRGFDAGKKVVGRKRHIAVDTDGDC